MMWSGDVSQAFATQNAQFMGQNQYAQSIGVMPLGGIGSWGGSGGHGQPFSYAQGSGFGSGYGGGNKFASIGMSALGGAASIGSMMAFDPFGSFLGGAMGGMARGGIGAALGGGMAAALPMLPVAMAAQAGIGAFVRGGQEQSAINTTLGRNFNFHNPMSRTGSGFTRDDAKSIGDMVRSISHIPEMMTSVEELTKLMPKLKQSGVMQGVKNAAEFQSRFKEAVTTIRDMSKILGTTMEEAEQFFAHSRSVGFLGKQGQLRNALSAQLTAGMTGMSNGQVMALQSAGAGMATQVGARRSLGASAVTNMAQTIGLAQRTGRIQEGMLEDMTGLQGGDAVQAAAQRMTEAMYNFSQRSPVGRLMMAGLAKFDDNGKAVGLDEKLVRQLQNGSISIEDLKRRASNLTNDQKISFTHRQAGTLAMSLAGQVGVGGVSDIFNQLVGGKGTDADRLVMGRHTGLNEQELDVAFSMGGMGMGDQQGMQQMAKMRARESEFREKTDPSAILKRLKTRLHASTLGGIEQAGAKVFSELGKAYDSFIDDVVGRHIITLSKEGSQNLARAMSGGSKKELMEMFEATSGLRAGSGNSKFGLKDGLTLFAGGVPGAILTQGGRNAVSKLFDGSEMKAMLSFSDTSTGRDAVGQLRHGQALIGGVRDANYLNSGLVKGLDASGTAAMKDAQGVMRGIVGGIENFSDMDEDKKLDELRSAIRNQIFKETGRGDYRQVMDIKPEDDEYQRISPKARKLINAMKAAERAGAKDNLTGLIAGTLQGEIDFTKAIGSEEGANSFYGIKAAKRLREEAMSGLEDALGSETATLVSQNPEARKVISEAMKDDSIRSALKGGDPEEAARTLKAKGFNVDAKDIKAIRDGLGKVENAQMNDKDVLGAFSKFDLASKAEGGEVILGAIREKAGELNRNLRGMGAGAGKDALSKVASAMEALGSGKGDAAKNFQAVQDAMAGLSKAIGDAKGEDKDALIQAAGAFGENIAGVRSRAEGLSGKVSQEEVAKRFGLDLRDEAVRDALSQAGVVAGTGGVIGAGVDKEKLINSVAGLKNAAAVGSAGATSMAGVTDMPTILTKIDKTLDKNMAVMTLLATGNKANIDQKQVEWAQNQLKETVPPPGS